MYQQRGLLPMIDVSLLKTLQAQHIFPYQRMLTR